ncbi:MAG: hypothetical protein HC851_15175 [Acaryochloris sp. RU_4_1]|nr:hypothetical protein [Acaryochloris sp. RU_4_1]NJR56760.1 hypothetical protein [Acaryochloris sp. CRU_2_0]
MPTAFHAPIGFHSQKPEVFYEMADRLGDAIGGQRVELFARCDGQRPTGGHRPGWVSWGTGRQGVLHGI